MVYQSHVTSLSHSIQTRLGIPVLAEIPIASDGTVPDPPDESFLEGVRFLRAGIQSLAQPPRVITIVTVAHSIQAMTVTRYVARSFAESGRTVITALVADPVELAPLLPLPAGAELPTEIWTSAQGLGELVDKTDSNVLVIYCPPAPDTLSAISGQIPAVLLVNDQCTMAEVRRTVSECNAAGVPAIAAAVLTHSTNRRWPFSLLRR